MPGSKRTPSPQGLVSFPPRHLAHSDVFAVQGPFPNGRFSFGLTPLQLSPELSRFAFKAMLSRQNLLPVWDFALEHGRLNLSLPFNAPPVSESNLRAGGGTGSKVIFEIPTLTDSILQNSRSLENFASAIGAEPSSLRGRHLWIVYENDGAPPFNPGSGSDQGPTAFLGIYFSFDDKSKGLTKVGWTVIDMRTPKGTLPSGAPFSSSSRYETPRGPYSGISSIDFTVTVHRTGQVKIDILGAVGVDSSKWGKFVQDAIHEKISNSPLFPWPKDSLKPFAEGGVAVLLTPQKILSDGEVLGISY